MKTGRRVNARSFFAPWLTFPLCVLLQGCTTNTLTTTIAQGVGAIVSTDPPNTAAASIGINCRKPNATTLQTGSCTKADIPSGVSVVLRAKPADGFALARWEGDCTGSGDCTVTMAQSRNVKAFFTDQFTLSITKSGAGGVRAGTTVIADNFVNPPIDCGPTCSGQSATFASTATVIISGFPSTPLAGPVTWNSGPCVGTNGPKCSIQIGTANVAVTMTVP